eukprot:3065272-Rhodomonas_salina.3
MDVEFASRGVQRAQRLLPGPRDAWSEGGTYCLPTTEERDQGLHARVCQTEPAIDDSVQHVVSRNPQPRSPSAGVRADHLQHLPWLHSARQLGAEQSRKS